MPPPPRLLLPDDEPELSLDLETWEESTSPSITGIRPRFRPDVEGSLPELSLDTEYSLELDELEAEHTLTRSSRPASAPPIPPSPQARSVKPVPLRAQPIPRLEPPKAEPSKPEPIKAEPPKTEPPKTELPESPKPELTEEHTLEIPKLTRREPSGIPYLLQLATALFIAIGGGLACPIGGSLPMLASAWEGTRDISLQRGEALALGVASTNAALLGTGQMPDIHPFEQEPGVLGIWIVNDNQVLAPPHLKGQAASSLKLKGTRLEEPIRWNGADLGVAVVDYSSREGMRAAGSPLVGGLLALVLAGCQGVVGLFLGWWLVLRPWLKLARDLRTGTAVDVPGDFRPMWEVAERINKLLERRP